jgi:hypothetical protein
MSNDNVMREFTTRNYTVRVSAEEEWDLDLSFDETGRVLKQLERGDLIAFVAHVEVIHKPTGMVIGEDYLGGCIYKNFDDFMDHRACGKQNRKWAKQGKEGRCGSYFAQMIGDAIAEARESYPALVDKLKQGKLRVKAA